MKKDFYSQKIIDFLILGKKINLASGEEDSILKKASENRVLYELCTRGKGAEIFKSVSKIDQIIKEGDFYLGKLTATLKYINKEFTADKLVVKTNKIHRYITYDVDLLVKNPKFFVNKLQISAHPQNKKRKQTNLVGKGLLTIDLHSGFHWQGSEYLDIKKVWLHPQKVSIRDVAVLTPSREAEILINLAHLLFERRYLTILEFWYFFDEFKKGLNLGFIFNQVKDYQWTESLQTALAALETLAREFTGEKGIFSDNILPRRSVCFPFFFSLNEVLTIFKEKFVKKKEFPMYDIGYYLFATLKYYLSGKKNLPYYKEWHRF